MSNILTNSPSRSRASSSSSLLELKVELRDLGTGVGAVGVVEGVVTTGVGTGSFFQDNSSILSLSFLALKA